MLSLSSVSYHSYGLARLAGEGGEGARGAIKLHTGTRTRAHLLFDHRKYTSLSKLSV